MNKIFYPLSVAAGFISVAACVVPLARRMAKGEPKGDNFYSEDHPLEDKLKLELDEKAYVKLLAKLIGEAKHVQNMPPELIPQEDKVVKHVVDFLKPYSTEKGGPLIIKTISYTEGRSNMIIKYPGTDPSSPSIGLIGSHLDVVPAYADSWERDPFKLSVEGDKLYGRGTTDCLGHVALITCLLAELAKKGAEVKSDIVAVFIASEENEHVPGVGVDGLVANGELEDLKSGICLWIDCSDSEPCMGTAGSATWTLTATGKRFHSGFPNKTVNPIELVSDALAYLQKRFYKDFPATADERRYKFETPSTFKPTQMKCADGSLNQIPPHASMLGDIRILPFYDIKVVKERISQYVQDLIDEDFASLPTRGSSSKYNIPAMNLKGKLELVWSESLNKGIAVDIDSKGFHTLVESIRVVRGEVKPYSIAGSLPLVKDMQESGFDLQLTGFGLSSTYHAENEYCLLSDMVNASRILSHYISGVDTLLSKNI